MDEITRLMLAVDELSGENAESFNKTVTDELGLNHQVCESHANES